MIERLLYTTIAAGVKYLSETPGVITDFFVCDGFMDAEEAAKVEQLWKDQPPAVIHGYARKDNKFPLFAVTLAGDTEQDRFLGGLGSPTLGDDGSIEHENFAAFFQFSFNILVYTHHPDHTLYNYHLVRQILLSAHPAFAGEPYFLDNMTFSGADLIPDQPWMPAGLFLRRLTFNCRRECSAPLPSGIVPGGDGPIRRVQGIHVDERGAPGKDTGGAITQVYPVAPEEK